MAQVGKSSIIKCYISNTFDENLAPVIPSTSLSCLARLAHVSQSLCCLLTPPLSACPSRWSTPRAAMGQCLRRRSDKPTWR
eukprot:762657-Hanusia_phi.AAC.4